MLGASSAAVRFAVGGLAGGDQPVCGLAVGGLTVGGLLVGGLLVGAFGGMAVGVLSVCLFLYVCIDSVCKFKFLSMLSYGCHESGPAGF